MKPFAYFILPFALLAACSETNLDDLNDGELEEIEKQVEEDAKSLIEAADEAVIAMEEDIQAELNADGVGVITDTPSATETEETVEQ